MDAPGPLRSGRVLRRWLIFRCHDRGPGLEPHAQLILADRQQRVVLLEQGPRVLERHLPSSLQPPRPHARWATAIEGDGDGSSARPPLELERNAIAERA